MAGGWKGSTGAGEEWGEEWGEHGRSTEGGARLGQARAAVAGAGEPAVTVAGEPAAAVAGEPAATTSKEAEAATTSRAGVGRRSQQILLLLFCTVIQRQLPIWTQQVSRQPNSC